jgi:hypothetical protein
MVVTSSSRPAALAIGRSAKRFPLPKRKKFEMCSWDEGKVQRGGVHKRGDGCHQSLKPVRTADVSWELNIQKAYWPCIFSEDRSPPCRGCGNSVSGESGFLGASSDREARESCGYCRKLQQAAIDDVDGPFGCGVVDARSEQEGAREGSREQYDGDAVE